MTGDQADSRIGIFLCRCGHWISGAIDLETVAERSLSLPNVEHVQVEDFLCMGEGMAKMKKSAVLFSLDKVIVGACSPLLYLEKFRTALGEVGVSRNVVDMVSLREQCGSIHWRHPRLGTAKACDLVKMAVAKANVSSPSFKSCAPVLEPEICNGCGACRDVCRTKSIQIVGTPERTWRRVAIVNGETCTQCGACVAACPNGARDMGSHLSNQIIAQIDAASDSGLARDLLKPRVLVFVCNWCTYFTADLAGVMRLEMLPHFLPIKVPCCSEIDSEWILKAFARGIDGILVVAGTHESCRHGHGYERSRKRAALINSILMRLGLGSRRLKMCWIDPNQAEEYAREVSDFIQLMLALGPSPLRLRMNEIEDENPIVPARHDGTEMAEGGRIGSETSDGAGRGGAVAVHFS